MQEIPVSVQRRAVSAVRSPGNGLAVCVTNVQPGRRLTVFRHYSERELRQLLTQSTINTNNLQRELRVRRQAFMAMQNAQKEALAEFVADQAAELTMKEIAFRKMQDANAEALAEFVAEQAVQLKQEEQAFLRARSAVKLFMAAATEHEMQQLNVENLRKLNILKKALKDKEQEFLQMQETQKAALAVFLAQQANALKVKEEAFRKAQNTQKNELALFVAVQAADLRVKQEAFEEAQAALTEALQEQNAIKQALAQICAH